MVWAKTFWGSHHNIKANPGILISPLTNGCKTGDQNDDPPPARAPW